MWFNGPRLPGQKEPEWKYASPDILQPRFGQESTHIAKLLSVICREARGIFYNWLSNSPLCVQLEQNVLEGIRFTDLVCREGDPPMSRPNGHQSH